MRLLCLCLTPAFVGVLHAGEQWPLLRHTSYVVALAPEGSVIRASLSCERRASYPEWLQYTIIDSSGAELARGEVAPGDRARPRVEVKRPGIHVIELACGWNVCTCAVEGLPYAQVVKRRLPLQTIGPIPRMYFYVPGKCAAFSVFFSSSVTGEGLRLRVRDPEGRQAGTYDGDADDLQKLSLRPGPGQTGKAWSFAIEKPTTPGLALDDVLLHFSDEIPPFVAARAEWAQQLGEGGLR